jgi:dipeptidase E
VVIKYSLSTIMEKMKYYLSSFRIGNHKEKLLELSGGGSLAYIPNAQDNATPEVQSKIKERNQKDLEDIGISYQELDLKNFFSEDSNINQELSKFSGVWIIGGNTFVLRQAMKLSKFDQAITERRSSNFLYAGYSAGICILAPRLEALQIVDDPNCFPYSQQTTVIWEGLNFLDYVILPHYKSNHHESADIDKEVEFCERKGIAYKTLRDGEVLFGEEL